MQCVERATDASTMTQRAKQAFDATEHLARILRQNRGGSPVGAYSICSANRFVLEAGMFQAQRDDSLLLLESTCNQVNQFGGYTGQTPTHFVLSVREIAAAIRFPTERIIFGGDHLGPHVWRKEAISSAMQKAIDLVRACVLAGYTKLHLDASMHLASDDSSQPLAEEVISARAADLCRAAEDAHAKLPPGSPSPLYVIGSEVPVPGGELLDAQAPETTRADDVDRTIQLTKQAFEARGLQGAWERVIAIVVQPGVEFGEASVFPYLPHKARKLARFAEEKWQGVYEAHSTDYQTPSALRQLVRDHFAILKVGPQLTFAFREAVFALAAIEEEWLANRAGVTLSRVRESLEEAMLENPEHWKNHYRGDDAALRFARKYSLSDRSRYYWAQPSVAAALERLIENLTLHPAPVSLLSQYLPAQSRAVRAEIISNHPVELIHHKILEVIDHYAYACGMRDGAPNLI
jgi:D-tagatose-1,6-bisphosphate aldolase subunit GatZ/KbaZ